MKDCGMFRKSNSVHCHLCDQLHKSSQYSSKTLSPYGFGSNKATIGGKMLCPGPWVVGLIIFFTWAFLLIYQMQGNTCSIEISTGSLIDKSFHHVVRISLGTPIGGLKKKGLY